MKPHALARIRAISQNASTAEEFLERFVTSIGGIKTDNARGIEGAVMGGADYLLPNDVVAELKILEKDVSDEYNTKMDALFSKYKESGELESCVVQEEVGNDDPAIPDAMRMEWNSILLKPIKGIFRRADGQIAVTKRRLIPTAKGLLFLLNIGNRLHAEPTRLYWLVRDHIMKDAEFPDIDAWIYFSLPVPRLMSAGVNQDIFWYQFTRFENETPEGWKDQILWLKCRGLQQQWLDFMKKEFDLAIRHTPPDEIRSPKP
jgi:hypothetical protein